MGSRANGPISEAPIDTEVDIAKHPSCIVLYHSELDCIQEFGWINSFARWFDLDHLIFRIYSANLEY